MGSLQVNGPTTGLGGGGGYKWGKGRLISDRFR